MRKYIIDKQNITKPDNCIFESKDYFEIILISRGSCYFEFDDGFKPSNTETAVFLKPHTQITMDYRNDKKPLEIFTIRIYPDTLQELSDETCDLVHAFSFIPRKKSLVHLAARDSTLIKNIASTMFILHKQTELFGHDLYMKNMLSILLILFVRSCIASDHVKLSNRKKQFATDDIFRYIQSNLSGDLSLGAIAEHFHMSKAHFCREFERLTGEHYHMYILKSRLDLSKKYIETGMQIKQLYSLCGFNSYNHFFRAFKKEYGMTPKKYYQSLSE